MYMSTHYIQNIVTKNVHEIMRICAVQTARLTVTKTSDDNVS
jgi:hypothetical protein